VIFHLNNNKDIGFASMRTDSILTCILLALCFPLGLLAQDTDNSHINSWLDRDEAVVGSTVRITIELAGEEAADCDLAKIPTIPDITVDRLVGPVVSVRPYSGRHTEQGKTELVARFEVFLIPKKEGKLTIPPIRIIAQGGKEFFSSSLPLKVVTRALPEDRVDLEVRAEKYRIYLHEPLLIKIKLKIKDSWFDRLSNASTEEFLDLPWLDGIPTFILQELTKPSDLKAKKEIKLKGAGLSIPFTIDSVPLDTIIEGEKPQAMYILTAEAIYLPTEAGSFEISSSTYGVRLKDSRSVFCSSDGFKVEVTPLKMKGRPAGFTTGVGDFKVSFKTVPDPVKVMVGESIKLIFSVEGWGNLEFLEMPQFPQLEKDFRLYGVSDNQDWKRKVRIFDISPKSTAIDEIPSLSFSYFNPKIDEYVTKEWGPKRAFVSIGDKEEVGNPLNIDLDEIATIKQNQNAGARTDLVKTISIIALFASILLLGVAEARSVYLKAGKRRFQDNVIRGAYSNFFLVITSNGGEVGPDQVAKALAEYIANRFSLSMQEILSGSSVAQLISVGIAESHAEKADEIFRELDAVRFASDDETCVSSSLIEKTKDLVDMLEDEVQK